MSHPVRVAVIGAGSFACRYHIPNLLSRRDATIVAIVKRTEAHRRLIQDRFNIPAGYADVETMLAEAQPEAVIVCSPHHLHGVHCRACLERGLPVLVEKPLTVDPAEARELVEMAKCRNIPFLVAYNRRVDPAYRWAARWIQEERIGEIRFLEGRRFADLSWMLRGETAPSEEEREKWWPEGDRPNFRAEQEAMGEGFLDDGGTHILDALLWLACARPTAFNALQTAYASGLEVRSAINVKFENGVLASISSSGDTAPIFPYELLIHGSRGALALSKESFIAMQDGKKETITPSYPPCTTTGHFIDCLQNPELEVLCPAESAIAPVVLARIAFASARTGQTLPWKE